MASPAVIDAAPRVIVGGVEACVRQAFGSALVIAFAAGVVIGFAAGPVAIQLQ